jgi:hypothetical protein
MLIERGNEGPGVSLHTFPKAAPRQNRRNSYPVYLYLSYSGPARVIVSIHVGIDSVSMKKSSNAGMQLRGMTTSQISSSTSIARV